MSKEKIIVALDVSGAEEAREIVRNLRGEVGAFKIGLQLFTSAGAKFVRELTEAGEKIFLDLKFHDIPNTVANASVEAARMGVWMFNLHTIGGSEMLKRAVIETGEACAKENLSIPKIIGVTVLTSSNDETLRETGIEAGTDAQVLRLAKLAEHSNLDGIVASPLETRLIRQEIKNENFLIVTPGVRLSSQNNSFSSSDDQKRVTTPDEAVNSGADYLVIGRPVTKAENPKSAVREIIREIEEATEKNGNTSQTYNI